MGTLQTSLDRGSKKTGKVVKSSKLPDWNIPQLKRSIGSSWCYHDWVWRVIFQLVASTKFKSRPLWIYGGVLVPVAWVAFISVAAPLMFHSAWTTCCHRYVFFKNFKCLLKLSVVIFQTRLASCTFLLYSVTLKWKRVCKSSHSVVDILCKMWSFLIKAVSKSSNKRTVKAVVRKLYLSIKSKITHSVGWTPRVF